MFYSYGEIHDRDGCDPPETTSPSDPVRPPGPVCPPDPANPLDATCPSGGASGGPDVFGLVGVQAVLARAVGVDPAGVDDDGLHAGLLALEAVRSQLDVLSARLLVEAERRDSTDSEYGMSTPAWLAHKANLPIGVTRARVRVANRLARFLPAAMEALEQGRIGWDHATVLANLAKPRIRAEFCEVLPHLITIAEQMTFEAWKREVTNIAELLDADGGHRPGDDIEDNVLRLSPLYDNTIVISGQLCGELALAFRDAIADRAQEIFRRFTRDNTTTDGETPVPERATLQALALVELVRENQGASSGRAPRTEISLVINATDPDTVCDRDGVIIGDTGQWAATCDPVFTPIVMNTQGVVTNMGRTQRLASEAQRKAMAHRDGGCVFPGCDRPPEWTDAHHIQPWQHGGPTDLALLASLCRHHHMVTHRTGWTMNPTPDQWFTWTTPRGHTLWSQRHGQQHPNTH